MAGKSNKKQNPPANSRASAFGAAVKAAGLTHLPGKEAIEGAYRSQITTQSAWKFTGSVDVDTHFKATEAQSHRWDYGIGVGQADGQELVCWVEPHPASSTGEVTTMLAKLDWLKKKLDTPAFKKLKAMTYAPGRQGNQFLWLRTINGECRISVHGKEAKLLAKNGLRMPAQHLILP